MLEEKPVEVRTRIKNNLTHTLGHVRDTNPVILAEGACSKLPYHTHSNNTIGFRDYHSELSPGLI